MKLLSFPRRPGRGAPALAVALTLLMAVAVAGGLPCPARATGTVLVVNSAGASLSVVDLATHRELRRIPVLREPHHVALTPDGAGLLVGDTVANQVLDLDPVTFALRRRYAISDPYQLGFSPDGRVLTVTGLARNQVDIYDAGTMHLLHRFALASMPSHLAYSPDSSMVFVSLQGSDRLAALDLRAMTVRWEAKVGRTPAGVMWHDGGVLVANMGEDDISVVDPVDGATLRRVRTGMGAHNLFLSPDGRTIWVNNRVAGTTTALDAATLAVRRTYRVPGGPDDIAFAPDGALWITQRFARSVAVLDPATGQFATAAVGRSPHGLFVSPQGR
jgi:DNA-binding beta-propeller fold protein YncE